MPAVPKPPKRIKNKAIYKQVEERDGCKCQLCGKSTANLEIHHVTSRAQRGSDELDNLISLCKGNEGCHTWVHKLNPELTRFLLRKILSMKYGYTVT